MPRNVVGYFLLSFVSFCFFTIVFNGVAIAQVWAEQPSQQTTSLHPAIIIPTPTLYNSDRLASAQTNIPVITSPTPTIYIAPQVLADSSVKPTQEMPQPTATPVPPTDTYTPTVLPTATATPTPDPQPTIATTTDLETLFSKYSAQYSISKDELKKIANCESGFSSASDT